MKWAASLAFALTLLSATFVSPADARAATGAPCGTLPAVDSGGDDGGGDGGEPSDDGGACAPNEYCALPDGAPEPPGAGNLGACATQSCGGGQASCPVNVYCAQPDGGPVLDGGPGLCSLEPCVLASDCSDPDLPICDTSQTPYACVACISTADCPGDLVCLIASHTCVNPPPVPDASAADGSALDGGAEDGEAADGATDAALGEGGASGDASGSRDGSGGNGGSDDAGDGSAAVGPSATDEGSLTGGAWDCNLALSPVARDGGWDGRSSLAALALPLGCVALFLARRRRRARRPGRAR